MGRALQNVRFGTRGNRTALRLSCLGSALLVLAACSAAHDDVTGSLKASASRPMSTVRAQGSLEDSAARYATNPNDKEAALNYALALRANARYAQAVAILENVAIHRPNDQEVLGAYGKALADVNRLQEAAQVLANAQSPQHPDWSILSAQGAVADQLGDHGKAQEYYETALKIVPGEPSVLSNLGLSYALSKKLDRAEEVLSRAAADPRADKRVRQNLALILALRGKFAEAERIELRDLPPAEAAANVDAVRKMIAQSNTWREIQQASR